MNSQTNVATLLGASTGSIGFEAANPGNADAEALHFWNPGAPYVSAHVEDSPPERELPALQAENETLTLSPARSREARIEMAT